MHARDLADLATLLAVHGEELVSADAATMDHAMSAYWKASRCRLDRWHRSLAPLAKYEPGSQWTGSDVATIEEIFLSEILTRVVAAISVAHDLRLGVSESAPVARNIFCAHLDVRRRAMSLVVAPQRDSKMVRQLIALRRQCERWADLLLAYLAPYVSVGEFAANAARVADFAYDAREHLRSGKSGDVAVTMIVTGMRTSLGGLSSYGTPNVDLNHEIATALISGFRPQFFDSYDHLRSVKSERVCSVPDGSSEEGINSWCKTAPHGPHDVPRPLRWPW